MDAPPSRRQSCDPSLSKCSHAQAQYYCNAMPWVNCTELRYHCTKHPDVDLCPLAYAGELAWLGRGVRRRRKGEASMRLGAAKGSDVPPTPPPHLTSHSNNKPRKQRADSRRAAPQRTLCAWREASRCPTPAAGPTRRSCSCSKVRGGGRPGAQQAPRLPGTGRGRASGCAGPSQCPLFAHASPHLLPPHPTAAVDRFGDDWPAIAEAVGTKNAMQCCTRFLQLPIESSLIAEAVASDGHQGWVRVWACSASRSRVQAALPGMCACVGGKGEGIVGRKSREK